MITKQSHFVLTTLLLLFINMNSSNCIRFGGKRPPVEHDFKDGFYMIVGSEKVIPNSEYIISAIAQNNTEPVKIELKLFDKDDPTISAQERKINLDPSTTEKITFNIGNYERPNLLLEINATLAGKNYSNSIHVNYNPKLVSIFIQTDKALYKPGEKVNIRTILTDSNLLPLSSDNQINVHIADPKKNRIKQWLNASLDYGVFTGSFQLNEEQTLGDYVINVEYHGNQKKQKVFEVNEYVLPQFDVKIIAPKHVTYDEPKFTASVDAKYTHGKSINGILKFTMRQRYFYPNNQHRYWPETKSLEKFEIEKAINGNVDIELNPVKQLSLISTRDYDLDLELKAVVVETHTKKNFTASSYLSIMEDNVKIELLDQNEELKPGLPIEIEIKVVTKNDEPITDSKNKLKLGYSFNLKDDTKEEFIEQDYEIKNGLIDNLKLDVPENATDLYLRATYKDRKYSIHQLQASKSKNGHFVQLNVLNKKSKKNTFKTGEKVEFEIRSTKPLKSYTMMIIKQNNIISKNYVLNSESKSENFSIDVEHKLAPGFKVIVFYLTNENQVVSDQKSIEVSDLFLTPIELKSSTNQSQPGDQVDIIVKTSPNAYVGVLGVDQGVLLLKSGNDITKQDILNDLNEYGSENNHYYRGRSMNEFFGSTGVFSSNNLFCIINGFDVNQNYYSPIHFKSFGMKRRNKSGPRLADIKIVNLAMPMSSARLSIADESTEENAMVLNSMPASFGQTASFRTKQKIQIRKDFPETWLFDSKKSNENDGQAVFSSKIPDTITSWIVSAFAVDPKTGLVIADNKEKVTVFRPFFLKMNLPYSIIRGEIASIQILVFNYMDKDQKVRVSLMNDKDQYKFISTDGQENDIETDLKMKEQIIDVAANNISTVSFMISAKKAGNLILKASAITLDDKAGDRVEKALKVKSEGQPQYKNKALLINVNDSTTEQLTTIEFPENAIEGSKLINLNAIGDILGTSMSNLGDLVRLPYGCGEQVLVNFVPNIVILDYLTQANKLNDKIKQKAIRYLESGYQRELRYQRTDGSFSAFGQTDKEGSTWLTAFVVKSFVQAKRYIDIDPKVIDSAVQFLIKRGNKTTGSFEEKGQVFSKALQGGVSKSTLPLTAYVLNALNIAKKNNVAVDFDLKNVENYLSTQSKLVDLISNEDDPDDPNQYNYYQLAIIAHALHEVDSEMKDEVYEKLWKLKQTDDNKLFFDKKEKSKDKDDKERIWYYYVPNSNGVEASSYALLTSIKRNDTDSAIKILNWLISKQNNNGGFASTQDTVIALEALAAIASKLYVPNTDLKADFMFEGLESDNLKPSLKVDDSNSLEMQTYQISETNFEEEFKKINKVKMTSSGKGSAVIQVGWQYNVATESNEYFNITAKTNSQTNEDGTKDVSEFELDVCVNYKKTGETNMAVIEIETPSGYIFKADKIDALRGSNYDIKRIDMKNSGTLAVFYFDKFDSKPTCFKVEAERMTKVAKLKPALVKVYDYYKIEENGRTFYELDKINACDICEDKECTEKCKNKST